MSSREATTPSTERAQGKNARKEPINAIRADAKEHLRRSGWADRCSCPHLRDEEFRPSAAFAASRTCPRRREWAEAVPDASRQFVAQGPDERRCVQEKMKPEQADMRRDDGDDVVNPVVIPKVSEATRADSLGSGVACHEDGVGVILYWSDRTGQ